MKFRETKVTKLFNIEYPIIQGGMVWCSGWRLASAVSNSGGMGLLGAGSMYPDVLREHIQKMRKATDKPWGVNIPLIYPNIDEVIQVIVDEKVEIVFTSAGNPMKYTSFLQEKGIKVAHLVANSRFVSKCVEAGVDAIVAEGFEAGGHNGREETTTMNLIPLMKRVTDIPLIAAGGIGTGSQIAAAFALGAEGVQIGSLFALSEESSAHENFKNAAVNLKEGETILALKQISPTRMMKNEFYNQIKEAKESGKSVDELREIVGKGRAKKGIFEGDLKEGELEIGQVASLVDKIKPVSEIFNTLLSDYKQAVSNIPQL